MIELKPGDYVLLSDIKNDAQAKAIADAFISCGAIKGAAYPYSMNGCGWFAMVWNGGSGCVDRCGNGHDALNRQLTPAQILGETQWVPEVGEWCLMQSPILGMWANEWLEVETIAHKGNLVVGWCEDKQIAVWSGKYACKPLPTEEDRAVEEMINDIAERNNGRKPTPEYPVEIMLRMLYQAGYRKQPQPAEDISD